MVADTRLRLRIALALLRLRLHLYSTSSFGLLLYGLAIPLGFLWWSASQSSSEIARGHALMGTLVFGACFLIVRFVTYTLCIDRFSGPYEMLETTPVTRNVYFLSHLAGALALGSVPLVGMGIALAVAPNLAPASIVFVLPYGLIVLFFGSLGVWIACTVGSHNAGMMLANLVAAFVVALCPLLYPLQRVPEVIRPVIGWLPPSLAARSMAEAWSGAGGSPGLLFGLALWTVALLVLARRGARRI